MTPYAGICGITKEELMNEMSDDIERLAEELRPIVMSETFAKLKGSLRRLSFCMAITRYIQSIQFTELLCQAKDGFLLVWFRHTNLPHQYDAQV